MKTWDRITKDITNLPIEAKRALACFILLVGFIALMYGRETAEWEIEVKEKPKVSMRQLMSACMDVMRRGGAELVRIRQLADIGEKSKGRTQDGSNDPVTEGDLASHRIMYYGLKQAFPTLKIVSEERDNHDMNVPKANIFDPEFNNVGEEIEEDRIVVWIDPLDATQEYTEGLTEYVTVMAGIAIDGMPIGGLIHKPFTNETLWSFTDRKSMSLTFAQIHDMTRNEDPNDERERFVISRTHGGDVRKQLEEYVQPKPVITAVGGAGYKIWEVIKGDHDAYVHTAQIKKWDLCAGEAILNSIEGRMTDLQGKDIMFDNEFDYKVETGMVATKTHHNFFVKMLRKILE